MTTRFYVILRNDLSGAVPAVWSAHAGREAPGPRPSDDERVTILVATKAQIQKVREDFDANGIQYKAIEETDGVMEGSIPCMGFAIMDSERASLKPFIGHMKAFHP